MHIRSIFKVLFISFSLVAFGLASGRAAAPVQASQSWQEISAQSTSLQMVEGESTTRIPAPQGFLQLDPATAAAPEDFIITFEGDWSEEAKTAFNYAASIWSYLIDPSVKISINADTGSCFFCGAQSVVYLDWFTDMPPTPRANTIYPRALLNHVSGYDYFPYAVDFKITYDSDYDWYYGTDGNTPGSEVDFVSVVLHEIAHGLGFVDSFFMDAINGWWGSLNQWPIIYDAFIVNGAGQSMIDTSVFPDYSPELKAQLETDDLYFDGPNTRLANQNQPAKVAAFTDPQGDWPNTLSHLNTIYNGTTDGLMTDTIFPGDSYHNPGPIVLGILADLGWTLSPNLPVFNAIPSQMMLVNTQRINAIDLWSYIPAHQSPETNFTYVISNTPAPEAGVSLHDNRYIDVVPAADWLGKTLVTIRATNLEGISASATFNVLVLAEIHSTFLPTIAR